MAIIFAYLKDWYIFTSVSVYITYVSPLLVKYYIAPRYTISVLPCSSQKKTASQFLFFVFLLIFFLDICTRSVLVLGVAIKWRRIDVDATPFWRYMLSENKLFTSQYSNNIIDWDYVLKKGNYEHISKYNYGGWQISG